MIQGGSYQGDLEIRAKLGAIIGHIEAKAVLSVTRALAVFFAFA